MSHQIEDRDIQYGVTMAWHNKTQVKEILTMDDVYAWQVLLAQEAYILPDGSTKERKGYFVPIASDDLLPLGTGATINVDSYSLHTPQEAWKYMQEAMQGINYQVVSAGTVANRGKFFISFKLLDLEAIKIADGTTTELLFNTMGSLDKSLRSLLNCSGIRPVCANTIQMNYVAKTDFRQMLKHTRNMGKRLEENKPLVEAAVGYSAIVKATFDSLVGKPCNKDRARETYAGFLVSEANKQRKAMKESPLDELSTRMENQIDEHVTCFEKGKGNSGVSEYDLLNGFTEPRSTGFSYGDTDKFKTFESSEFGTYARQKGEFAALLTSNRTELAAVESTGRSILGASKIVVATN